MCTAAKHIRAFYQSSKVKCEIKMESVKKFCAVTCLKAENIKIDKISWRLSFFLFPKKVFAAEMHVHA